MYREQEVVRSLREVVDANIARHEIDLVRGQAVFENPHTLRVGERQLYGDVILIATGSVPTRPHGVPFNDRRVHDSDEILTMTRLPRRLAVVGAGVIGCEYATIFAALGIHDRRRPRRRGQARVSRSGQNTARRPRHRRGLINTVFSYPSLGDAYKYAAFD